MSAASLNKTDYNIKSLDFNASSIDPNIKDDFILYRFENNQHKKAFTSKKIISKFKEHGLELTSKEPGIIHVQRVSTIDYSPIKEAIKSYYLKHLPTLKVNKINLQLNGFIKELPLAYTLNFKPKAFLYNTSTVQMLPSQTKQRYFISYKIQGTIKLFKASHNINRGKILTKLDLSFKQEKFSRLKNLPLVQFDGSHLRANKRLLKNRVVYEHDIEALPFVLKGKPVNVRLISGLVHLEFQATALADANKNEFVFIKRSDGKKLRAKVVNRNLVEVK